MIVSYSRACEVFMSLPEHYQAPTLHPSYLLADARRDERIDPIFWLYQESGAYFYYGFHKLKIPGTQYYDIQSPYGYGGPLASSKKAEFLDNAWRAYTQWCSTENIVAEFVRFHPMLVNDEFYKGNVINDRDTVWIDLSHDELSSSYKGRVRTAIKKAHNNGLSLKWYENYQFLSFFPDFYREAMESIGTDDFYLFSDEYFESLIKLNNVELAVCLKENSVIAAAIFFVGPELVEYHLSCANECGKENSATNILLHEAALRGKELGCKSLYLGGGNAPGDDNPLLFFKKGFSKETANYKIGKTIHNEKKYKELINKWPDKFKQNKNRVLFYR